MKYRREKFEEEVVSKRAPISLAKVAKLAEEKDEIAVEHIEVWRKYLKSKGRKHDDKSVVAAIKRAAKRHPKLKVSKLGEGGVVVSAPDFDEATHWGSWYFVQVGKTADSAGINTRILYGPQSNPASFHHVIRNIVNASYVSGIGHGDVIGIFTGQNFLPLMLVGDINTKLTSQNRIFHFVSCYAGRILGAKMVNDYRAKAFFGYVDTFWMVHSEPEDYPNYYAKMTMDCANTVDYILLNGGTCGEAVEETQKAYASGVRKAPSAVKPYLQHNADAFVFYGDPSATIYYTPPPPEQPPKKFRLGPICRWWQSRKLKKE